MKKILTILLLLLFVPNLPARELKKEWREYQRLARKDRPRDQIEKLHEIRKIALERRYPDDLMDACRNEERIYSRLNWKSTDSLSAALLEVVESYGEPLLTYRWLSKDWEYAQAHQRELLAGNHPSLQDRKVPFLQTKEENDIANDFEWVLWDRLTRQPTLIPDSEEYRLLSNLIGDRYPARPYLSYLTARRAEDRLSAMQELYAEYNGDPFRFLPEKVVLEERLSSLQKDKTATEDDFKTLYEDTEAFEKAVMAEKRIHRRMDLSVNQIKNTLKRSTLSIKFRNDSIILIGRNFGRGTVVFHSDENRRTFSFRNRDGRFYVLDTVIAPVPVLPDGSYYVYSEKYGGRTRYEKHTLSLAVRQQGGDLAVYVADYQTGEPLSSATLRLYRPKNGKKIIEREIPLNGFTILPADFQRQISNKILSVEARIGERRSSFVPVYQRDEHIDVPPATIHGRVFKDRGAYRPGDTLKAKAVLFKGDLNDHVNTLEEGEDIRVHIFNAEGITLADIDLKTNSFGSVAWEWPIPSEERNGLFGIYVYYRKTNVTHSEFRVDDFVLPTFELSFDPQNDPFLPDTDIEVRGMVASYSGHPVDGVSLEGTVTRNSTEIWKGSVPVDLEGSFRIPLHLKEQGEYKLDIHAVDATGETRQFEHRFTVSSFLSVAAKLGNAADGDFSLHHSGKGEALLTESLGHFVWTVKNGRQPVQLPISYRLLDANGNMIQEGITGETLDLDMSACPDGLYFLQGTVAVGESQARDLLSVMKWTNQSVVDTPVRSVFLSGETQIEYGETIRAIIGAGNGPLWAVATLFDPKGIILESRSVHLDGNQGEDGSVTELVFPYKGNYPDAVRLEVFYFRDAEQIVHEAIYHRIRHSLDLPLSFSRFVDQTMPGAPCTLSLQTEADVEASVAVFDKSLDAMVPNRWEAVTTPLPSLQKTLYMSLVGNITGEKSKYLITGNGPVFGIVVDPQGEPIIGTAVIVEGTEQGTITDLDGRFSLDVPAGTRLQVSSIGYVSTVVSAASGMYVVLEEDYQMLEETVVVGYGSSRRSIEDLLSGMVAGIRVRSASSRISSPQIYGYSAPVFASDPVEEETMPDVSDEDYRAVFSEALAFEPFLYPDKDGKVDVSFRASDKVSTYHVNVYAHDRSLRNASIQRDFVVTVPVRISVTPPRYLYENDEYELSTAVTSVSEEPVSGRLYLQAEAGDNRQPISVADLIIPAGGTASAVFSVAAPNSDGQPLDLRLVFESPNFSDAIRFTIPVYQAAQLLTETHSALAGTEAIDSLRQAFVNIPGELAEVNVRTLRELVESGLEQWTSPEEPDALSLSADFYARAVLGRDTTGTLAPLLALRSTDGGFAWTDGMDSSPIVTATILERFAVLRDRGIPIPDMEATVHYLDCSQFGNWMPMWCGGLSDEQYMDIRAMWASVPLNLDDIEEKAIRRFRLREFRRFARAYLTPGRYDYANGWILDKARRVRTLQNLTASDDGIALGQAWGEQLFTASRFERSILNDIASLEQYAVRHPSGALYYPNAVLPFRGLLSSEVYAHTLLSTLLGGPISDGIKLWLMLQNETQSWTDDPAYVEALQTLLAAPDSLLDRQIVSLMASVAVPFEDIQASGNGMKVTRRFFLEKDDRRTEIQPGDTLRVGDRLIASYELWSAENRSFVRVDAFREACFLPVEQHSGPARVSINPIRIDGLWTRLVQCYRDIRSDRTCWWLDVCPEENSRWEESFFVTQAGTFSAPVVTVESLYAPDYRANGMFRGPMTVE